MTVGEALVDARRRLAAHGIPPAEAARDAAGLAMHVLGTDRATLLLREPEVADPAFLARFGSLVARREGREPMAYIRGWQEFWGRTFAVSPAVLIPRPETEHIIEQALAWRTARQDGPPPRVIDVGTGSGCLAVTLALEWPDARVDATEVSRAALDTARGNAERHAVVDSIGWHRGTYFAGLTAPVDIIVSNPPYIRDDDVADLQPEVRDYEPSVALAGGRDGLRDIHEIVTGAGTRLVTGGRLLVEVGAGQAASVEEIVRGTPGLSVVLVQPDLQGIPRVVVAERLSDSE